MNQFLTYCTKTTCRNFFDRFFFVLEVPLHRLNISIFIKGNFAIIELVATLACSGQCKTYIVVTVIDNWVTTCWTTIHATVKRVQRGGYKRRWCSGGRWRWCSGRRRRWSRGHLFGCSTLATSFRRWESKMTILGGLKVQWHKSMPLMCDVVKGFKVERYTMSGKILMNPVIGEFQLLRWMGPIYFPIPGRGSCS